MCREGCSDASMFLSEMIRVTVTCHMSRDQSSAVCEKGEMGWAATQTKLGPNFLHQVQIWLRFPTNCRHSNRKATFKSLCILSKIIILKEAVKILKICNLRFYCCPVSKLTITIFYLFKLCPVLNGSYMSTVNIYSYLIKFITFLSLCAVWWQLRLSYFKIRWNEIPVLRLVAGMKWIFILYQ